jgi:hypothetical protein
VKPEEQDEGFLCGPGCENIIPGCENIIPGCKKTAKKPGTRSSHGTTAADGT